MIEKESLVFLKLNIFFFDEVIIFFKVLCSFSLICNFWYNYACILAEKNYFRRTNDSGRYINGSANRVAINRGVIFWIFAKIFKYKNIHIQSYFLYNWFEYWISIKYHFNILKKEKRSNTFYIFFLLEIITYCECTYIT